LGKGLGLIGIIGKRLKGVLGLGFRSGLGLRFRVGLGNGLELYTVNNVCIKFA
jgi:hypothetical protein